MDYDVIVAGGGPTGLWLACELGLARVRVAVLEKLAEPTGLSKALGRQASSAAFKHRSSVIRNQCLSLLPQGPSPSDV